MFYSLWRKVKENILSLSRRSYSQSNRHVCFRPRVEALEDRVLLSTLTVSSLQIPKPTTNALRVTVVENSPKTVIDLAAVFARMSGIRHEDGLQMSMMGNTNSGLVKTALSECELTLNYAPRKFGTATIVVGAADADGVSVRENIVVTVLPEIVHGS
jgi:hypothetical protein